METYGLTLLGHNIDTEILVFMECTNNIVTTGSLVTSKSHVNLGNFQVHVYTIQLKVSTECNCSSLSRHH